MRNAGGYGAVTTHAAAAAAICRRDVSAISDGLSYFLRDYTSRFLDFYGFEAHCFLIFWGSLPEPVNQRFDYIQWYFLFLIKN